MKPFFGILILAIAVKTMDCIVFKDCGTTSGKVKAISVSNCPNTSISCIFKSGTNATIDVNFISDVDSNALTVKVWGIIGGVPIPFNLQPSSACGHWNIDCPLVKGSSYDLKLTVPILQFYPRIHVDVRVALLDQSDNKLFCQQFPAQIVA